MSKEVIIGKVHIGGGNKIAIQSMTNIPVTDIDVTLMQIAQLEKAGCDIVRVAVPDTASVFAIKEIKSKCNLPIVADIHFDSQLAVQSIENGADKIRINPGNMSEESLVKVIDCAKMHFVPIRIGVNSGSVNPSYLSKYDDKQQAIVANLKDYLHFFEEHSFDNLVLSVKSSDVLETIALNRKISSLGYPLHVGVTEAGPLAQGAIKNAIGIGSLLADGIGDTIRVSLTANPVDEVFAAKSILSAIGKGSGLQFVSCPKCGRSKIDLENIANAIYDRIKFIDKNIKVAVMGCEVNGPGECRDADLGLAGGNGKFVFFKKGNIFKVVDEKDAVELFVKEVENF